jgi:hypothetical protein
MTIPLSTSSIIRRTGSTAIERCLFCQGTDIARPTPPPSSASSCRFASSSRARSSDPRGESRLSPPSSRVFPGAGPPERRSGPTAGLERRERPANPPRTCSRRGVCGTFHAKLPAIELAAVTRRHTPIPKSADHIVSEGGRGAFPPRFSCLSFRSFSLCLARA